jgi:nucleoside-diphosphate-sugar epimerase
LEVLVSGAVRPALRGAGARRLVEGGARVVVTGASGWIGLATLEMLHGLLGESFQSRVACFGGRARRLSLREGVEVAQAPLEALDELAAVPSLVLHLGFITQGPQMTLGAGDYVAANKALAQRVISALDRIGAEAVFLASSGAAYLADPGGGPQSKELYGWLKVQDEDAFSRWGAERGKTVATARIFNLAGPYMNRRLTYALACFIADALAGRPITVRATHPVYRSYTAIEELMSVAFGALTASPSRAFAFDTAGEETLEMGELADCVAAALGSSHRVVRPQMHAGAAADRYVGDGAAYTALGRELAVARTSFSDQIRQTADYMAQFPEAA